VSLQTDVAGGVVGELGHFLDKHRAWLGSDARLWRMIVLPLTPRQA
jgi:hypothetical protein